MDNLSLIQNLAQNIFCKTSASIGSPDFNEGSHANIHVAPSPHRLTIARDSIDILKSHLDQLHEAWGFHSWFAELELRAQRPLELWHPVVRKQYLQNELRNSLYEREFLNFAQKLNSRGIRFAPLKGLWLSRHVLTNPGVRVFGDADIWVEPAAISKVDELMSSLGFYSRDRLHHKFHFHREYRKKISGVELIFEIHRELTLNSYLQIPHAQVWRAACDNIQSTEPNLLPGEVALRPDHQLIYIFCHSVIHGFDRLSRLFDLPVVYAWAKANAVDDSTLMAGLTEWRCRKMFLFALLALQWLVGDQFSAHDVQALASRFDASEISVTQKRFDEWLSSLRKDALSATKIHRRHLCDSRWQEFRGLLYPRRVIGAWIDRMGLY